jgi:UDP-N-acetylglucosamine 2-epimerase
LVFDGYAESHLRTVGHFPAGTLLVTGSPRLDALAARLTAVTPEARLATRDAVGAVRPEQKLAVLAAKFSEVRDDLPALVDAVKADPDIHLVIKAHPAESADVYTPLVDGIYNITVAAADLDLAALLAAADVIVTKNSTVAIDGLVLGIPAVVIGLPNNLSPFVEAGVMAGAGEDVGQALRAVLYDQQVRATLKDATVAFVAAHGLRATGTAATRAAEVIVR